jgi:hypothetical protein
MSPQNGILSSISSRSAGNSGSAFCASFATTGEIGLIMTVATFSPLNSVSPADSSTFFSSQSSEFGPKARHRTLVTSFVFVSLGELRYFRFVIARRRLLGVGDHLFDLRVCQVLAVGGEIEHRRTG